MAEVTPLLPFHLGYRPALDGIRAIAIIMVLGHHAFLPGFQGGFLGVDLFFVLSGFLITHLLVREILTTGRIHLRQFYIKRILRLFPALAFLIIIYLALSVQNPLFFRQASVTAAIILGYMSNWVLAFNGTALGNFTHTWSLSIEEQFYILFPLLLGIASTRLPWYKIRMGLLVIIGMVCVLRVVMWWNGAEWYRIYHGLDTRVDTLLWGCWLGIVLTTTSEWQNPIYIKWGQRLVFPALLLLMVLGSTAEIKDATQSLWLFPLMAILATFILFYTIVVPPTWIHKVLEFPVLVGLGKISYGLYLWHFPIFTLLMAFDMPPLYVFLLGTLLSLGIALLSYYIVEKPFLRRKAQIADASALLMTEDNRVQVMRTES